MREFLPSLTLSEGGKRFVLNLYWGLLDGLQREVARDLIDKAKTAEASGWFDEFFPECGKFRSVVYGAPGDYQFKGGGSEMTARGRWMTVKRADDVRELVEQGLGERCDDRYPEIFPLLPPPGSAVRELPDDLLREMASAINDPANALEFPLGIERSNRQRPTWFTRWCVFEHAFKDLPPSEAAGRLRDWLGLPVTDEPLFALRTKRCFEVERLAAHRPTVLDGFEGVLFKHRTGQGFPWIGCGSAADIELLRQRDVADSGGLGSVIDGGPELVSNSARFSVDTYECVFLGRATDLGYDPYGIFHPYLLPTGKSVDDVVQWVLDELEQPNPRDGAQAARKEATECQLRNRCSACAGSAN